MATKRIAHRRDPIALAKLTGEIATGQVVDRHQLCRTANLSMRMGNAPAHSTDQRFQRDGREPRTRCGNLLHAHKFVRIHQTLRCSPAMAAGVTPKLWELSDMVKVREDWEARQ
jgi:hypothetical protein